MKKNCINKNLKEIEIRQLGIKICIDPENYEETYPNKINIDKGDKVVPSRVLHLQKDDVYLIIPDYLVLGEGEKSNENFEKSIWKCKQFENLKQSSKFRK